MSPNEQDPSTTYEIRIEFVGLGLRLQVPEATALALGDPPAIRFYHDNTGRLRLAPTLPEIPGAIPIKSTAVAVHRASQPVAPPPLPPGRYLLAAAGDRTLVFLGMEGDASTGGRPGSGAKPSPSDDPDARKEGDAGPVIDDGWDDEEDIPEEEWGAPGA
jgi:hypothetical protein